MLVSARWREKAVEVSIKDLERLPFAKLLLCGYPVSDSRLPVS